MVYVKWSHEAGSWRGSNSTVSHVRRSAVASLREPMLLRKCIAWRRHHTHCQFYVYFVVKFYVLWAFCLLIICIAPKLKGRKRRKQSMEQFAENDVKKPKILTSNQVTSCFVRASDLLAMTVSALEAIASSSSNCDIMISHIYQPSSVASYHGLTMSVAMIRCQRSY